MVNVLVVVSILAVLVTGYEDLVHFPDRYLNISFSDLFSSTVLNIDFPDRTSTVLNILRKNALYFTEVFDLRFGQFKWIVVLPTDDAFKGNSGFAANIMGSHQLQRDFIKSLLIRVNDENIDMESGDIRWSMYRNFYKLNDKRDKLCLVDFRSDQFREIKCDYFRKYCLTNGSLYVVDQLMILS